MKYLPLLALAAGCTMKTPKTPWPVAIVAPIPKEKPHCFVRDLPEPPKMLVVDYDENRIIDRTFIHIRDYQALQQWSLDTYEWQKDVADCLKNQLTDGL